jgi:hypothetical protein
MAAAVKFILELPFGRTLNKTWPNSVFGTEEVMRKLADDGHNELKYIGNVERSCWRSCPQLPFYVPAMKGRWERVPDFAFIKLIRLEPAFAETMQKGFFLIIRGKIATRYGSTRAEHSLKNSSETGILKFETWQASSEDGTRDKSFSQGSRADFLHKYCPFVSLVRDVPDCTI